MRAKDERPVAARRALGNRTSVEERYYERRRWRMWDEVRQDVRQALRIFGRNKRFAAALVGTMALGVGANTALTGAIDEILWSPLGLPRADELVGVHRVNRQSGRYLSTSYPDFDVLRQRVASLRAVAGYMRAPLHLDFGDERVTTNAEWVTSNYFETLEVRPLLGRTFRPEEDPGGGAAPVVMLSERLWTNRFGRDPQIVGRSISLEGERLEVIGVVPEKDGREHNLLWIGPPELWLPIATFPRFFGGGRGDQILQSAELLEMIGRLGGNASVPEAQAEVETIFSSLRTTGDRRPPTSVEVIPAAHAKFYPGHRRAYSRQLALVGLAGALVLLLACSNIANLLRERISRRRQELALRASLGAGRARLIRQLLTEAAILAGPGALASLFVAHLLLRLLTAYPAALGVPLHADLGLTWRIVTISVLTSLGAAIACSLVPVLTAARTNLASAASSRDALATGSIGSRVTHALVAAQVAFSTVLLVGALLIVRGIAEAYDTSLGFQTNRLISLELAYSSGARGRAERLPDNVLDPARWNVPGVAAVAIASGAPLSASRAVGVVRDRAAPASDPIEVVVFWVTGNFFDVMDIPLIQGQSFDLNDAASEPTVVISRALADRLWKGPSATGRFIEGAQMDGTAQVVGVAEDARYVGLWDSRPIVYRRVKLDNRLASEVLLRTSAPPPSLIAQVRRAWRSMSPDLRISAIKSGDDYVRLATESQRMASHLFSVFALIALVVASIGVHSSMAWFVERRRREIAIRMAIGGAPGTIASRVVLRAGAIGAIGLVLGLGTAALLAPQLASVSRNASPYDALAFGGTAVLLAAVCLLAVVGPAVRASRVDPALVLRGE